MSQEKHLPFRTAGQTHAWKGAPPPILRFSGGNPLGKPNGESWLRRLGSEFDPLSRDEAAAVVAWANKFCREEERPEILRLEGGRGLNPNLAALAIMCQGYLAVHAEPSNALWLPSAEKSSEPVVRKALERMGWNGSLEGVVDLRQKRLEVRTREWWSPLFAGYSGNPEVLFGSHIPESIRELARLFGDPNLKVVNAERVALAYLALVKP